MSQVSSALSRASASEFKPDVAPPINHPALNKKPLGFRPNERRDASELVALSPAGGTPSLWALLDDLRTAPSRPSGAEGEEGAEKPEPHPDNFDARRGFERGYTDVYHSARKHLDAYIAECEGSDNFHEARARVARENPQASDDCVNAFAQAWVVEKIAHAVRRQFENEYEGQHVFMSRACALIEASLAARLYAVDHLRGAARVTTAGIDLAPPQAMIARALDHDFARNLAFELRACVCSDVLTAKVNARLASGDSRDRVAVQAKICEEMLVGLLNGDSQVKRYGSGPGPADEKFAFAFCEQMREGLIEGAEFTMRVEHHLRTLPGAPRESAQKGCAVGLARGSAGPDEFGSQVAMSRQAAPGNP